MKRSISALALMVLGLFFTRGAYAACSEIGTTTHPTTGAAHFGTKLRAGATAGNVELCYTGAPDQQYQDTRRTFIASPSDTIQSQSYSSSIEVDASLSGFSIRTSGEVNGSLYASSKSISTLDDVLTFSSSIPSATVPIKMCHTAQASGTPWISIGTVRLLGDGYSAPNNVRSYLDINSSFGQSYSANPLTDCKTGNIQIVGSSLKWVVSFKGNQDLGANTGNGKLSFTSYITITSLPSGVTCTSASGQFPGCDAPVGTMPGTPIANKRGLGMPGYALGDAGIFAAASSECEGASPYVGNPVDIAAGVKLQREWDYARGYLSFGRVYRSDGVWTGGMFGSRWRHNFSRALTVSGTTAYVTEETGAVAEFNQVGGNWVPKDPDVTTKFQTVAGGYIYTTPYDAKEYYNSAGRLTRIHYRGSQSLYFTYDGSGNLTQIKDEQARIITLAYTSGRITSVTTPGGVYTYAYSGSNLASVTDPNSKTRTYHYENSSFVNGLTGITDERGIRFATYGYDANGLANLTKHAGDVGSYQVTQNADGSVTTTNPLGKQTTYQFQTIHGVKKITGVQGHASTNCAAGNKAYTYDANGFLASKTDWKNNTTSYTYNAQGLLASKTEPENRTTTYTYHSTLRVPVQINEPGRVTTYAYDSDGRITSVSVQDSGTAQSRTKTYTYYPNTTDANGNPVLGRLYTVDGPRTDVTDVTTYEYAANGDLFKVINALGHVKEFRERDAAGRPVRVVGPNNVHDYFNYDAAGRLTKYTQGYNTAPFKGATNYAYYDDGRLYMVTLPNGVYIKYFYDNAGRLEKVLNSDSGIYYTRDNAGNVTEAARKKVVAGSSVTHRLYQTYDELSRLLSVRNNTNTTSYSYDLNSNVVGVMDAYNRSTVYEHDTLDRVKKITDRLSGQTHIEVNDLDAVTGVTNPKGDETTYTRNAFGEVMGEVSPERGTLSYVRDNAGNVTSKTDGRGIVTNYAYDALNRLSSVTYPSDSTLNVTYTYDAASGCGYSKGRLCSVATAAGTRSFVYTALGDVSTVTDTRPGSPALVTSYTYDTSHFLTGITLPSGRTVGYTYNLNGEVTGVTSNGANIASGFSYLAFGPASGFTYGNGHVRTDSYDDAHRLTGRVVGSAMNDAYTYDKKDNVRTKNGTIYDYDFIDRLIGQGADSYSYDANGNRTGHYVAGVNKSFTIAGSSSRVVTIGALPVTYDNGGNILNDGTREYVYDAAGRIKQVKVSGSVVGFYAYDGAHQRINKNAGGVVVQSVYGLDGRLLGEYSASGAVIREYIYGLGEVLAQVDGPSSVTYLYPDQIGTPRVGASSGGATVWSWAGDAYGAALPSGTVTVNLRMAGQHYDSESGLFYNWHRYYDPKTGRYITSDPIGLGGGINTYAYVGGNPVRSSDPMGLAEEGNSSTSESSIPEDLGSQTPDRSYNCAGAAMCEGEGWVKNGDDILDQCYTEVPADQPKKPGDVVERELDRSWADWARWKPVQKHYSEVTETDKDGNVKKERSKLGALPGEHEHTPDDPTVKELYPDAKTTTHRPIPGCTVTVTQQCYDSNAKGFRDCKEKLTCGPGAQ